MFRKLLSIDEAKQILERKFSPKPVGMERVPLSETNNRVLAEDVVAPMDVPPFDRATVDGYAVRSTDTFGADEDRPVSLRLCGCVSVGETPGVVVESGSTAEIATGAPLPQGADAVVMMEYAIQSDDEVFITSSVSKGENVMRAGSDIHEGEAILRRGQTLRSHEIGVLAALGLTEVSVYKRPRVAIISTGAEIVEPGRPLPPGKIYDINTHSLSAAVLECGGDPVILGVIPDEMDQLKSAIKRSLGLADIVITSGGVSVGPTDVIPRVLNTLGKPGVVVCGIASKPGKPTTIAIIDGKPVFSLPGHPTSSLLMFHTFVRPMVCSMAGRREEKHSTVGAVVASKVFPARGRRTFVMVKLTRDRSGRLIASPVPPGLSGAITTLVRADGFIEIEESQQFINAGEEVAVHLFKPLQGVLSMG
ncbi:MAG: molybdopterin biosynthesis protein MoeA [Candidatus Bathyarchaeota archaeon BA1]|nr:MAG: molybdopterin biosynthesis protein MoeA [Candidatus Bathyarchaeota archaeon BA1]